jgi:hypothetical protein
MRRALAAIAAALIALSLLPAPVAASPRIPLTGDSLGLYTSGVREMTTGQPFFVRHGFCTFHDEQTQLLDPMTRIDLAIDGRPVAMNTMVDLRYPDLEGCDVAKFGYHNFRFGMPAGTYRFDATWYWQGEVFHQSEVWVTFS